MSGLLHWNERCMGNHSLLDPPGRKLIVLSGCPFRVTIVLRLREPLNLVPKIDLFTKALR